ncbi:MAG: hypothetical protein IJV82_06455, partial [Oscillospiraceae bacterium]|nr:hypothetical protein [Oscillospiraceae bacterium]
GEAAYLLPQLFAPKTPKYIQYSWCFRDFKLGQNIHRPLENQFLEVPKHLQPCRHKALLCERMNDRQKYPPCLRRGDFEYGRIKPPG